jgi:hypothetical protein
LTFYINLCNYIFRGADEEEGLGKISITVPRHTEVKEFTAKGILKQAKGEE